MNWLFILSGTDWTHAAGFSVVAIAAVSFAATCGSRFLKRHPAARHGLLLSGLAACLAIPFVGIAAGVVRMPLLSVPVVVDAPLGSQSIDDAPAVNNTGLNRPVGAMVIDTSMSPWIAANGERDSEVTAHASGHHNTAATHTAPNHAALSSNFATPTSFGAKIGIVWLAGTVFLFGFALRAYRRGRTIRDRATTIDTASIELCVTGALQSVGLADRPMLLESSDVATPLVHGYRDPAVLLPRSLLQHVGAQRLADILVHEFAHVRRHDTLVVLVETVSKCLFWPIVTIHWLNRELGRVREEVCDNYVLTRRGAVEYAETLLQLAELACGRKAAIPAVGILNRSGGLEERVAGLLDDRRSRSRHLSPLVSVSLVVLFCVAGFALTATRLVSVAAAGPEPDVSVTQSSPNDGSNDSVEKTENGTREFRDSRTEPAAVDNFSPSAKATNAEYTLPIVDWQGNPVSGAKVKLWQLLYSSAKGLGGGSQSPEKDAAFEGLTDDNGRIVVPYPTITGPNEMPITSLGLEITHPNFPPWTDYREVTNQKPLKLARPVIISVSTRLASDHSAVTSNVFAIVGGDTKWTRLDGRLVSGPVDVSDAALRVVYAPDKKSVWFSDLIALAKQPINDDRISIDTMLHPSVRLTGRLSDDVARPIKNGRLVVHASNVVGNVSAGWSMTANIAADGTFVINDLPADSHVQVIALCDGGTSRSPRPSEVTAYSKSHGYKIDRYIGSGTGRIAAQLVFASADSPEFVIPIDPTGDVEVTVEDWDGKPIAGAGIGFSPNQAWHNSGSQILGVGNSTLNVLRAQEQDTWDVFFDRQKHLLATMAAITDQNGRALIRNLPAGTGWYQWDEDERQGLRFLGFAVSHSDYSLVVKEPRRIIGAGADQETVDMVPGGLAKIRVRMERPDERRSVMSDSQATAPSDLRFDTPAATPAKTTGEQSAGATSKLSANAAVASPATKKTPAESRPISVSGVARNTSGHPVANATIYLVSVNAIDQSIGSTTTDSDGRYMFKDVAMPVTREVDSPDSGTVNVFGTADGYGLIWHGMRHVLFETRPDNRPKDAEDHAFFENELIVMNLEFPPAAKLVGRITDDNEQPVANAKVSINGLDYLDTEGRTMHHNYREFWGLEFAPAEYRTARTDADGNFEITGLPQQSVAYVGIAHDNFARQSRYVAITDRRISEYRYISNTRVSIKDGKQTRKPIYETKSVSVSPLRITMAQNTTVSIRTVDENGSPLSDMMVFATSGTRATGTSAYGKTDAAGLVQLAIPTGDYNLSVRPPRKSDRIPVRDKLTVGSDPATNDPPRTVTVPPGCILVFKAIDADSGKPLSDVSFWTEMDDKPGSRTGLNSTPAYVDHPVSGDNGELRAVVMPGTRNYGVGWSKMPDGYSGAPRGREVKCESGKTVRLTFELRKAK